MIASSEGGINQMELHLNEDALVASLQAIEFLAAHPDLEHNAFEGASRDGNSAEFTVCRANGTRPERFMPLTRRTHKGVEYIIGVLAGS